MSNTLSPSLSLSLSLSLILSLSLSLSLSVCVCVHICQREFPTPHQSASFCSENRPFNRYMNMADTNVATSTDLSSNYNQTGGCGNPSQVSEV